MIPFARVKSIIPQKKKKKRKEIVKMENEKLARSFFLQDTLSAPYQSRWIIGIIRNFLKKKKKEKRKEKILQNEKKEKKKKTI